MVVRKESGRQYSKVVVKSPTQNSGNIINGLWEASQPRVFVQPRLALNFCARSTYRCLE